MHRQPSHHPCCEYLLIRLSPFGELVDEGLRDVADPDVAVLRDAGEVAEGSVLVDGVAFHHDPRRGADELTGPERIGQIRHRHGLVEGRWRRARRR